MNLFADKKTGARWASRTVVALAFLCGAMIHAEGRHVEKRVAPVYPELARRMHINGVVKLDVKVAPDGSVSEVKATNGNQLLTSAAEEAVRKWKFSQADAASSEVVEVTFTDAN
jgi:TonB family protein